MTYDLLAQLTIESRFEDPVLDPVDALFGFSNLKTQVGLPNGGPKLS